MGPRWRSPVSYDATSMAKLVEAALQELGLAWERSVRERPFEEVVLVLSVPKTTPAHRFEIPESGFIVEAYDTRPTPGALVPYLEVTGIDPGNEAHVRRLLQSVAQRAPRPPWRFTWAQRLAAGLLAPEFRRARRAWEQALARQDRGSGQIR